MTITQNRSVHKYYIKLFLAKFALKKQGLKALLLLCFKYGPQWTSCSVVFNGSTCFANVLIAQPQKHFALSHLALEPPTSPLSVLIKIFNRNLNRLQKQIFELNNATNAPWNIGKGRKNKRKLIFNN